MKRYLYTAKWISIQVGRLMHTNSPSRSIYRRYVRNKNWASSKTPTQKPTQNTQRSQPRYRDSLLYTSYLAGNRQPKDILKAQQLADYLNISLHQLLFDQPDARDESSGGQIPNKNSNFFKGIFEITIRRIE